MFQVVLTEGCVVVKTAARRLICMISKQNEPDVDWLEQLVQNYSQTVIRKVSFLFPF